MPALKVNIIIVHPRGVVFPSAGINCFVILKLYYYYFCITLILFRLIGSTGHSGSGHFIHTYIMYTF